MSPPAAVTGYKRWVTARTSSVVWNPAVSSRAENTNRATSDADAVAVLRLTAGFAQTQRDEESDETQAVNWSIVDENVRNQKTRLTDGMLSFKLVIGQSLYKTYTYIKKNLMYFRM